MLENEEVALATALVVPKNVVEACQLDYRDCDKDWRKPYSSTLILTGSL